VHQLEIKVLKKRELFLIYFEKITGLPFFYIFINFFLSKYRAGLNDETGTGNPCTILQYYFEEKIYLHRNRAAHGGSSLLIGVFFREQFRILG